MVNNIKSLQHNTNTSKLDNSDRQNKKIYEACQEFESIFISYLLKNMRKTIPKIEENFSREIYTSMMDEEVARAVAKGSGTGLADAIYYQLIFKKG
ncbi:MAG: rod-binding protein [Candidatus Poribacteria bacterium]